MDNKKDYFTFCNYNLITLKCVLFCFFGALGCLFPYLQLHLNSKNFTVDEAKIISIAAPCIALLGPLIVGPLADKLAGGSKGVPRSKNGTYLRVMIAVSLILSIVFYWILFALPAIEPCVLSSIDSSQCHKSHNYQLDKYARNNRQPYIELVCDNSGGEILVENCGFSDTCSQLDTDVLATFYVTNCTHSCQNSMNTTPLPDIDTSTSLDDEEMDSSGPIEADLSVVNIRPSAPPRPLRHEHLCYVNELNQSVCQVYASHSNPIQLRLPLNRIHNETKKMGVCAYPIGSRDFYCRVGPQLEKISQKDDFALTCNPRIRCVVDNPYNMNNSIFIQPTCKRDDTTFWVYLFIRGIADIFPAAAVVLLDAAVVIATRETSTGRGDVGKQFAVGALGLAIFPAIIGAADLEIVAFCLFTVLMVIAALIVVFDFNMPLSPPEWWWHTRCGLLAMEMSAVRKYGLETAALGFVMLMLGIFWNGIDPYLPWHILSLSGNALNIGLTVTVGALPAVLFLIFIERIVDYCGHTNLLNAAFAFYIIHYTALYCIKSPWLYLLCEALEIFTLHIVWVTAVLYLRHLIPRQFTVSGQALPVITHFCIGRIIGTVIAGLGFPREGWNVLEVYEGLSAAAAIVAIIYFLLYQLYLKPKCAAPFIELERPSPALIQNANGNGAYTPLKVYHNSRAKKGQFKY